MKKYAVQVQYAISCFPYLAVITSLITAELQAQQMIWNPVGGVGISQGEADYQSIDIDEEGRVWLVYRDIHNDRKTTVIRWNGYEWETIGKTGFSRGFASSQNLQIAPDGTPWIVYSDDALGGAVVVKKWNGLEWQTVGDAGISEGSSSYTNIAIDGDGHVWVAFRDWANGGKTTVMRWDGNFWEPVGGTGISGDRAEFQQIAIAPDGTAWVAYKDHEAGIDGKLTVRRWDKQKNEWISVGGQGITEDRARHLSLAIDPEGIPWVAFSDHSFSGFPLGRKTTVLKWDGNAWQPVGAPGISKGRAWFHSLTFGPDGTAWVAYRDGAGDWEGAEEWNTTVMSWNGLEWKAIDRRGISRGNASHHSLAVDSEGTPWLAYQDHFNFDRTTVINWRQRKEGDREMHEFDLELPVIVVLHPNYPNPFNPSTVISFDLPRTKHVQIDIFTSDGRFVQTLLNEEKVIGTHEVTFNATGLSAGVYFYRLKAGSVIRTKSMVIVN